MLQWTLASTHTTPPVKHTLPTIILSLMTLMKYPIKTRNDVVNMNAALIDTLLGLIPTAFKLL